MRWQVDNFAVNIFFYNHVCLDLHAINFDFFNTSSLILALLYNHGHCENGHDIPLMSSDWSTLKYDNQSELRMCKIDE